MFAMIRRWAKVGGRSMPTDPVEALGNEILAARPRRTQILREVRDVLIGLPMEVRPALVDQVAIRFAAYVGDLPSSERNHDAGEYGLLDHSLEVARATVGELVRPGFRVSEDPAANYREQPIWAYSGFVVGLLHDVGKVFDLDVVLPNGEAAWNPLTEPLATFLGRHGLRNSGRSSWRWKKGRGLNGHVWKGKAIFPAILPAATRAFLGTRLESLLETFTRSYAEGEEDWGQGPAGRVTQAVRHWDRALAKDELHSKVPASSGDAKPALPVPAAPPAEVNEGSLLEVPSAKAAQNPTSQEAPKEPAALQTPTQLPGKSAPNHRAQDRNQPSVNRPVLEREGLIRTALEPARLVESIRSWVRAGKVRRNSTHAEMFVCPEYLWLKYPQAFWSIMEGSKIAWSAPFAERLLEALLKLPEVVPLAPRSVPIPAIPTPNGREELYFVRIRAAGFLPESELASLGYWAPGIRVVEAAKSRTEDAKG